MDVSVVSGGRVAYLLLQGVKYSCLDFHVGVRCCNRVSIAAGMCPLMQTAFCSCRVRSLAGRACLLAQQGVSFFKGDPAR